MGFFFRLNPHPSNNFSNCLRRILKNCVDRGEFIEAAKYLERFVFQMIPCEKASFYLAYFEANARVSI